MEQQGLCGIPPLQAAEEAGPCIGLSITTTTGSPVELTVPRGETEDSLRTRISQKLSLQTDRMVLVHKDRWVIPDCVLTYFTEEMMKLNCFHWIINDRLLTAGKLLDQGVRDGSRLTLVPAIETGLVVSFCTSCTCHEKKQNKNAIRLVRHFFICSTSGFESEGEEDNGHVGRFNRNPGRSLVCFWYIFMAVINYSEHSWGALFRHLVQRFYVILEIVFNSWRKYRFLNSLKLAVMVRNVPQSFVTFKMKNNNFRYSSAFHYAWSQQHLQQNLLSFWCEAWFLLSCWLSYFSCLFIKTFSSFRKLMKTF